MAFLKESPDLLIPFGDIKLATNNFTTIIGTGGYGKVYKGELSISGQQTCVAVKRLDGDITGQGVKEFLTEIQLLSRYRHPNLVSLQGFCQDGDENILVYEYAENGSLDKYLNIGKPTNPLTWKQRINICIDAARGLDYLHNHIAENKRVIHRDIKSANILLDKNWKAMIADFGLSKIGRANENETFLITNLSGTPGYCDPAYMHTGILTKMSDVYSFGVVLFEVLCGRLSFLNVNDERRFLGPMAKRYYDTGKLYEIVDPYLKSQMKSNSLQFFSEIAYQCLHSTPEQRPSMDVVVQILEESLELQFFLHCIHPCKKDIVACKRCESVCPTTFFNKQAALDVNIGPWGGKRGCNWVFKPDGRITDMIVASSGCVNSLKFIYTCEGYVKHRSRRYGGKGGVTHMVKFADDEEIIMISGTFGVYEHVMVIRSLYFQTNKTTYGSFGTNTGTSFSLPLPKGKYIGFNGNYGDYLNSFGVILQPY